MIRFKWFAYFLLSNFFLFYIPQNHVIAIANFLNSTYIPSCRDLFQITNSNSCEDKSYRAGDCCHDSAKVYCLPTFTIAGAQKGGTTELQALLLHHPDVRAKGGGEIHFFDTKSYRHSCKAFHYAYQFNVKISVTPHGSVQPKEVSVVTMDKTPSYMREEETLQRMSQMLPGMKLILTLRHPTSRVISAFRFLCVRGAYFKRIVQVSDKNKYSKYINNTYYYTTPDMSFATYQQVTSCDGEDFHRFLDGNRDVDIREGLSLNLSRAQPDDAMQYVSIHALAQLSIGFYDTQLRHVLHHFPREQVLVVFQEEWMGDLPGVLRDIEKFLQLSPHQYPLLPHIKNVGHNKAVIRSQDELLLDKFYTNSVLRLHTLLLCTFNQSIPGQWRERLHKNTADPWCDERRHEDD